MLFCTGCDDWFFEEKPGEWEYVTEFPGEGREKAVNFTISDTVYIGLGYAFRWNDSYDITDTVYFNDLWKFVPSMDTWKELSDLPFGNITDGLGFSIDGKGYTILNLDNKNTVWEYNPSEDTWYKLSEFPGFLRKGAIGFTLYDKIYFGLGSAYDTIIHQRIDATDLWMYDPELNTWEEKALFPGPPRNNAAAFTIHNKAFICTGGEPPFNFDSMRDSWEYDPDLNTWTKKKDFGGYPRQSAVAFSLNNKGYVGTGTDYPFPGSQMADFWEYNYETNSWKQIAKHPGYTSNATGVVIHNVCYTGLGNHYFIDYKTSVYKLTINN